MTTRTTTALALIVLLGLSQSAFAHDASAHKGPSVHGTVASVTADTLTMTTSRGRLAVTLTGDTKVERGNTVIGRDALVSGAKVAVFGTKVPGEGLVAKEVVLEDDTSDKDGHGDGHDAHKH